MLTRIGRGQIAELETLNQTGVPTMRRTAILGLLAIALGARAVEGGITYQVFAQMQHSSTVPGDFDLDVDTSSTSPISFFDEQGDITLGGESGHLVSIETRPTGLKVLSILEGNPHGIEQQFGTSNVRAIMLVDDVVFRHPDPNVNSTVIRLTVNASGEVSSVVPPGETETPIASVRFFLFIRNGTTTLDAAISILLYPQDGSSVDLPLEFTLSVPTDVELSIEARIVGQTITLGDGQITFDATNSLDFNPEQVFELEEGVTVSSESWGLVNNKLPVDPGEPSADTDGDGLLDSDEINTYGTDPNLFDTDGDGLGDGAEVNTHLTDPLDADSDDDDLSDGDEIASQVFAGCPDPLNSDSDGDGLWDGLEVLFIPYTDPCNNDSDGDGLTDGIEASIGTDPNDIDTDDDGLSDGVEFDAAMGSACPDPLDSDSDDDSLDDGFEVGTYGTDPCSADTDGDGLTDDIDPMPTVPGVPLEFIESKLMDLADFIDSVNLGEFVAPNNNAAKGRRNSLANRVRNAAKAISEGDLSTAESLLQSVLEKVDGDASNPDWMNDGSAKAAIAEELINCLSLLALD